MLALRTHEGEQFIAGALRLRAKQRRRRSALGALLALNGIGIRSHHERYEELRIAYLALINLMAFELSRIADLYEPHGHVACGTNGMRLARRCVRPRHCQHTSGSVALFNYSNVRPAAWSSFCSTV